MDGTNISGLSRDVDNQDSLNMTMDKMRENERKRARDEDDIEDVDQDSERDSSHSRFVTLSEKALQSSSSAAVGTVTDESLNDKLNVSEFAKSNSSLNALKDLGLRAFDSVDVERRMIEGAVSQLDNDSKDNGSSLKEKITSGNKVKGEVLHKYSVFSVVNDASNPFISNLMKKNPTLEELNEMEVLTKVELDESILKNVSDKVQMLTMKLRLIRYVQKNLNTLKKQSSQREADSLIEKGLITPFDREKSIAKPSSSTSSQKLEIKKKPTQKQPMLDFKQLLGIGTKPLKVEIKSKTLAKSATISTKKQDEMVETAPKPTPTPTPPPQPVIPKEIIATCPICNKKFEDMQPNSPAFNLHVDICIEKHLPNPSRSSSSSAAVVDESRTDGSESSDIESVIHEGDFDDFDTDDYDDSVYMKRVLTYFREEKKWKQAFIEAKNAEAIISSNNQIDIDGNPSIDDAIHIQTTSTNTKTPYEIADEALLIENDNASTSLEESTDNLTETPDNNNTNGNAIRIELDDQGLVNFSVLFNENVEMTIVSHESTEESEELRCPIRLHRRLFEYQKTGVRWLWELHARDVGGIIGDEMGLGKTVQISAFLGCLHATGLLHPTLIVAPATTLTQWVNELHTWHAPLRVFKLHKTSVASKQGWSVRKIVSTAHKNNGVIVTTYSGLQNNKDILLKWKWGYVILDEGHKISNPDADITLTCKALQTSHRIIMTGAPIQNKLQELWSLFDFVYPGKLGTLPIFVADFVEPINVGGYVNASQFQIRTAFKCAKILRDTITPYLLRRLKKDVGTQLPQKIDQVFFCNITKIQKAAYLSYIDSEDVQKILKRRKMKRIGIKQASGADAKEATDPSVFRAMNILQKICNHPQLLSLAENNPCADNALAMAKREARKETLSSELDWKSSGKMLVLKQILSHWKSNGNRVLLFTQGIMMLDILERFVNSEGYSYLRMDGTTNIGIRASLIKRFNNPKSGVFVFLLTTRVGGLGVNLIGADRIVIFDPDWNPSVDIQAGERAWRIGQTKPVTIYRLISAGTIEEKIYQRQIFKRFLTGKILHNSKQKRLFSETELKDLFSFVDPTEQKMETETSSILTRHVEGEQINALNRLEQYKDGNGDNTNSSSNGLSNNGDNDDDHVDGSIDSSDGDGSSSRKGIKSRHEKDNNMLLSKLFESEKVFFEALSHTNIENAAMSDAVKKFSEEQASEVAERSQKRLKRSQNEIRKQFEATREFAPTWTGQSGSLGKKFGGKDSMMLLRQIQSRANTPGTEASTTSSSGNEQIDRQINTGEEANGNLISPETRRNMEVRRDLVKYLKTALNTTTDSIINRFQGRCDPDAFREMLYDVAMLSNGKWKLKR